MIRPPGRPDTQGGATGWSIANRWKSSHGPERRQRVGEGKGARRGIKRSHGPETIDFSIPAEEVDLLFDDVAITKGQDNAFHLVVVLTKPKTLPTLVSLSKRLDVNIS